MKGIEGMCFFFFIEGVLSLINLKFHCVLLTVCTGLSFYNVYLRNMEWEKLVSENLFSGYISVLHEFCINSMHFFINSKTPHTLARFDE